MMTSKSTAPNPKSVSAEETLEEHHQPEAHRHKKIANHGAHGEEGEEGEPWLLSYADMVTLLMCFFILFFSINKNKGGVADPEKLKIKLESLIAVELSTPSSPSSSAANTASSTPDSGRAAKLKQKVKEESPKIVFALTTPEPGVTEITFLNADFYESGKAVLTPAGVAALDAVAPRFLSLSPDATIEVQGHTDSSRPVRSPYPSNWELSTARASSIARSLIERGVQPSAIMVSGYGENRPLVPERDARGQLDVIAQRLNRRVVIRVRLPMTDPEDPPPPTAAARGAKKS